MPSAASPIPPAASRLASLDAYRGAVMIALASNGFGIAETARHFPESGFWQHFGYQFEHVPWVGCAFWDLIQPSFMFMVGVALPFSLARRQASGAPFWRLWGQALLRSLVLILLGIVLSSNRTDHTNFTFVNVLTQIGLGYGVLFVMAHWPRWTQILAAIALLVGYWAWFATYPLPVDEPDWERIGITDPEMRLEGFEAHWQKNANAASDFDVWFLNLFPRPEPFTVNAGGYATLNFIPSLVTMLFGLMTGQLIRRATVRRTVLLTLLVWSILGIAAGYALDHFGVCPLVKRIWTPSWTLFSTGWTLLFLAGFYGVIDVLGFRAWSFPLQVAGMNSIALYVMSQLLRPWTLTTLKTHFGHGWPVMFGEPYQPIVESCAVLGIFWLTVYWLYRQRIFFRI